MSEPDSISSFWKELAEVVGRLPEHAIKLVLIDANATFDAHESRGGYYAPVDANAEAMLSMLQKTDLCASDLWDAHGHEVTTWRSPNGAEKALDFICFPRVMASNVVTLGSDDDIRDLFSGIDHRPIWVEAHFIVAGRPQQSKQRPLDCKAMQTPEGRTTLACVFAEAPQVPWSVHACDHWEIIKNCMVESCGQHFPMPARRPRKSYISDEMFHAICLQRQLRMELRHRNQALNRRIQAMCVQKWSEVCGIRGSSWWSGESLIERHCVWMKQHDFAVADKWRQLTDLRKGIRHMARGCQADRAKAAFAEARESGPKAIANRMTSLMKAGRRYKPPRLLPPIVDEAGAVMTNEDDVMEALGNHFATAERAVATDLTSYRATRQPATEVPMLIDGSQVPSLAELACAFRSTKAGKAPGPSGLVPDIFRNSAQGAAMAMYPLFLKQVMRCEMPEDFLRSWIRPIPKPGKSLSHPAGWRSIALQEIPSKAISATSRRHLLRALDRVASPLQLGGRAGGPMAVPSMHVWGHLRRMRALRKSAGVLFIDGAQAFYSVIRELVIGVEEGENGLSRIIAIIEAMHPDEQIRADVFRLLCGPSILEQAETPAFVQNFLRQSMTATFFQLQPRSDKIYTTTAGTVPGTPLADVVYQLAVVAFHHRLQSRLEEAGLLVAVEGRCQGGDVYAHTSSMATWVDDIALPVSATSAVALVPKIAKIAAIAELSLAVTGVQVNYSVGKTEAIVCFRGRGASSVRRFWMVEQGAQVAIPCGPGKHAKLVLSTEYVHLGCRMQANGMSLRAIEHRLAIAKPVFAALRKPWLFNDALSQAERMRLVIQGPIASLMHGSGVWDMEHSRTVVKARDAMMSLFRQCVRPLTGMSCRGLTNAEVCRMLGAVQPEQSLQLSRMRVSISIAGLMDECLLGVLVEEQSWLCAVLQDWHQHCEHEWANYNNGIATLVHGRELFEFLGTHKLKLQASVRKIISKHLQAQQKGIEALWAKVRWLNALYSNGAISFHPEGAMNQCKTPVACSECHRVVHGSAALASHRRRVHGQSSLGAMLGDFTCCPICLTEFWTCERLWMHLRKVSTCRLLFISSDPDLLPSKKLQAEPARWPACKVSGPKPWWAYLRVSEHLTDHAVGQSHHSDAARLESAWQAFKSDRTATAEWVLRSWSGIFQVVRECAITVESLSNHCTEAELVQIVRVVIFTGEGWAYRGRAGVIP